MLRLGLMFGAAESCGLFVSCWSFFVATRMIDAGALEFGDALRSEQSHVMLKILPFVSWLQKGRAEHADRGFSQGNLGLHSGQI